MSEPDNWKSKFYNGSTSAIVTNESGNVMTNNRPYVSRVSFIGAARIATGPQYENCINTSITQRQRYLDTAANSTSGIFGTTAATIASLSQIINDYTPTYQV